MEVPHKIYRLTIYGRIVDRYADRIVFLTKVTTKKNLYHHLLSKKFPIKNTWKKLTLCLFTLKEYYNRPLFKFHFSI